MKWNWGEEVEIPERVTEERVQEMIDDAIRKHNRNASIISMCVGWVVLALFAEGLLRLIGVCLLYTSPSPRDLSTSRMPSSA